MMTRRQLRFAGSYLGILLGLAATAVAREGCLWVPLAFVAAVLIAVSSERRYERRRMKRGY